MSTEDAKAYLSSREVPRLFECLMTGLMFHRPNDHIQYLIDSLEKVKVKGQAELTWNMFVEVRSAKTPLPPITPDNGRRPTSRGRITPKEEPRPLTPSKTTPLPPIGSSGLPNVPVIFIMGGPGSGKSIQANKLAEKHPGWVNVHLGELLRDEIATKDAEDKWKSVKDLVVSGELAPEDVTLDLLLKCFKNNTEANGFIIQGFPRDMEQAQAFEKTISRVDAVFLLDCEEDKLTNIVLTRGQKTGRLDDSPSALARRMTTFKEKTLPVLKYYDDGGKLYIVDGDQDEDTMHDELSIIFETLLQNMENGRIPSPPAEGRPATGRRSRKSATPTSSPAPPAEPTAKLTLPSVSFIPPPEIKVKDEGRKPDLPTAPVIFLAGGPGSGKGTQCEKIMARYPDIVHLSMGDILRKEISERGTADEKWGMITKLLKQGEMAPVDVTEELLIQSMKEHADAKAFLVEGYPRDAMQYEDFNRNIGGHNFTILLDCEDQYLHDRLVLRGAGGTERIDDNIPAIEKKLAFFARTTLPLLKAIEDENKLIVIDGDRDQDEIFYDIVKCLDFSLYGVELLEVDSEWKAKTSKGGEDGEKGEEKKDEDEGKPVIEEMMVAATATTTGGGGGNPEYSAQLDAGADSKDEQEDEKGAEGEIEEDKEAEEAQEEENKEEEQQETVVEEVEGKEEATEQEQGQEVAQEAEQTEQSANQEEEPTQEEAPTTQETEETNEHAEQSEAVDQSEEQDDEQKPASEKGDDNEEGTNQTEEENEAKEDAEGTNESQEEELAQRTAVGEDATNENAESSNQEADEATEDSQQKEGGEAVAEEAEKSGEADTEKAETADTQQTEATDTQEKTEEAADTQKAEEGDTQKSEEADIQKTEEAETQEKKEEENTQKSEGVEASGGDNVEQTSAVEGGEGDEKTTEVEKDGDGKVEEEEKKEDAEGEKKEGEEAKVEESA